MAEYIKREDIIKWIDDSLELCGDRYSVDQENMMELFRTVINDCIPAADVVEVRHGRWIYDCERTLCDGWIYKQYHCSACGRQEIGAMQNYCPNCGADMRGEDDV